MSGGMNRHFRTGPMLGERVATTRARDGALNSRAPSVSLVLVDNTEPGLIARWRHTDTGWEGLVATVGGPDDFIARWLSATRIAPMTMP